MPLASGVDPATGGLGALEEAEEAAAVAVAAAVESVQAAPSGRAAPGEADLARTYTSAIAANPE